MGFAMVDGGGDFLDVVQEAGAAGGPHSGFLAPFCLDWDLWEDWGGVDVMDVSDVADVSDNGALSGCCLVGSAGRSKEGSISGDGVSGAGAFLAELRRLGWRERMRWRSVSMCANRKTVRRRSYSSAGISPVCT